MARLATDNAKYLVERNFAARVSRRLESRRCRACASTTAVAFTTVSSTTIASAASSPD
jgi:hypothetical protein